MMRPLFGGIIVAGKSRTVYFFEPVVLDQNDHADPIAAGFWNVVFSNVAEATASQRRMELFGRRHEGVVRQERSPALQYIYLGKLRPGADWPDVSDDRGEIASLASTGFTGSLVEPAYLLDVEGTNYVAVLRTSGGPSTTAIVRWLNQVCGFTEGDNRLELRPFARRDQLERLGRAQQAAKVHLKVDAGVMDDAEPTDELGRALKLAQSAGSGGVSVELTVSFGNARPTDGAGENLVESVRHLLASSDALPFKAASATVVTQNEAGDYVKDKIDFFRDRVTVRQEVGADEEEEPTPAIVLRAMSTAINKFREHL